MSLETEIDDIIDPLIVTFSAVLEEDLNGELVAVYVDGDAQMVKWAGQPYEGPPIKSAVKFADQRSATLIKDLDATTRSRLRNTIANAINEKQGVDGLARSIRQTFDNMTKYRSEMIARTETANALGEAFMERGRELGITGKEWVTAGDDRVTTPCLDNEAEGPIPIEQSFPSGAMHPPEHPNCRCATAPVML